MFIIEIARSFLFVGMPGAGLGGGKGKHNVRANVRD